MSYTSEQLKDIPLDSLYDLLKPITIPRTNPRSTFINWGLSYTCSPLAVFEPSTEYHCALILELARREGRSVRAAGVGHSPSDLACTSGYMVRTEKLCKIIEASCRYLVCFCFFSRHLSPFISPGDLRKCALSHFGLLRTIRIWSFVFPLFLIIIFRNCRHTGLTIELGFLLCLFLADW